MEKPDANKIMAEAKKAMKKSYEQQMSDTIKKEFPDVKDFTVNFDIDKMQFFIVGLTPEKEAHLKQL